jgi:hypothetical protein
MLGLLTRLARIAAWLQWDSRRQTALQITAVAVVAAIGLADAMTGNVTYFEMRQMSADVGRWVQHEFPARPMIVGPVGITPIASYYSQGSPYHAFRWEADDAAIMTIVRDYQAGVVLLRPTKQLSLDRCEDLVERMKPLGLKAVDPAALPDTRSDIYVLVRSSESQHLAQIPRASN